MLPEALGGRFSAFWRLQVPSGGRRLNLVVISLGLFRQKPEFASLGRQSTLCLRTCSRWMFRKTNRKKVVKA